MSSRGPNGSAPTVALVLVLALVPVLRVSAQDPGDEEPTEDEASLGVEAVSERPIPSGSELDPTASATSIPLRDRARALETLDEIALEVPGAVARRTGGRGALSVMSLRGAGVEHTAVVLGRIPLASPDGSALDLSTVPTWALDRVEIFRGGVPIELGTSAIGGVVRLVPRLDPRRRFEAAGGVGSFALYEGRVAATVRSPDVALFVAAGATSFGGRFPYVDDNRTALDPTDDRERRREGADVLDASALFHLTARTLGGRLEAAFLGFERTGGLSPPPSRFTDDSRGRRSQSRYVLGTALDWSERDDPDTSVWRVGLGASFALERRRVSDPLAQFGLVPRETDDLLLRFSARGSGALRLADVLDASVLLTYAREGVAPRDGASSVEVAVSERDLGTAALEARLHGRAGDVRMEMRASGRVELADARVADFRTGAPGHAFAVLPGARLGAVIEPFRGIAIAGSFSYLGRLPSVLELFGDRGLFVGSTSLRPEQALSGDLGLSMEGEGYGLTATAEVRGFVLSTTDLVVYRRIESGQIVPENVGSTLAGGIEARLVGQVVRNVELLGSLTWLDARDTNRGTHLALRPPLTGYARLSGFVRDVGALDRVVIYADVEHVASTFADPANLVALPERTRLGCGVALELVSRVEIALSLRDVFDQRGYDLLGLPLPGRSIALSFVVRD